MSSNNFWNKLKHAFLYLSITLSYSFAMLGVVILRPNRGIDCEHFSIYKYCLGATGTSAVIFVITMSFLFSTSVESVSKIILAIKSVICAAAFVIFCTGIYYYYYAHVDHGCKEDNSIYYQDLWAFYQLTFWCQPAFIILNLPIK